MRRVALLLHPILSPCTSEPTAPSPWTRVQTGRNTTVLLATVALSSQAIYVDHEQTEGQVVSQAVRIHGLFSVDRYLRSIIVFMFVLSTSLCLGCRNMDDEAMRLLSVAENRHLPVAERAEAVLEIRVDILPRVREPTKNRIVKRLIRLVDECWYDALAVQIMFTLGDIGDPEALPILRRVQEGPTEGTIPGQINVALEYAIRGCGGDP